jgi:hypothetical protein
MKLQKLHEGEKLHEAEKLRDDVEIASGFPLLTLAHRTYSTCGSDRPC